MLKGNNITIHIDDVAVAKSKSCEIHASTELLEKASYTSGKYREFIPGREEWNISCSSFVTSVKGYLGKVGNVVRISIGSITDGTRVLSDDKVTGEAIIKECKITATRGNLAQGSFVFQGSGPLE